MNTLSIVTNALMAAIVIAAWLRMALHRNASGALTGAGIRSMKFFTVLSNQLQALSSLALIGFALTCPGRELPRGLTLLRYAAAASVCLTFVTVMAFLGPTMGYKNMFTGSNLWFHLVVPLMAIADVTLLMPVRASLSDSLIALIPALAYGVAYSLNLALRGMETNGRSNDWYGFARGGLPGAVLSFSLVLLTTWLIALALRLPGAGL